MGSLKAPLFCFLQTVNKAFTEKEICNLEPSAWSFTKKDKKKKKKLLTTGSSKAASQLVQSLSCVRLFATPRTAACQASLSIDDVDSVLTL